MAPEDDPWDDLEVGFARNDFWGRGDPKLLYLLGHVLEGEVGWRIEHLLSCGD